MKYLPALLTPFLASPPASSVFPLARSVADSRRSYRTKPCALILLRTLSRREKSELLCNQANPNSFAKIPGWGGVYNLFSLVHALSTAYHSLPTFSRHLFSRTYELPPPHRFASLAFSSNYESLFSQLPCFQKHLRCPLLFFSRASFQKVAASFCETSGVGAQRWPSSGRLDAEPASESGRYIQTEKGSQFMGLGVGRRLCSTRFHQNRRWVRLCVVRRIGRHAGRRHLVSSGLRRRRAR